MPRANYNPKKELLPSSTVKMIELLEEWYEDKFPTLEDYSERELWKYYGRLELIRELREKISYVHN